MWGGAPHGPCGEGAGGGLGLQQAQGAPPAPWGLWGAGAGLCPQQRERPRGGPGWERGDIAGTAGTQPGELLGSPARGVLEEGLGLVLGDTARGLEQVQLGTFSNRNDSMILGEGEPRASISSVCMGGCKRMEPGSAGCAR